MLENVFKILFVLGFVATIVTVVGVALALAVPMKEMGRRASERASGASHV